MAAHPGPLPLQFREQRVPIGIDHATEDRQTIGQPCIAIAVIQAVTDITGDQQVL